MGKLSLAKLGLNKIPNRCFVVGGNTPLDTQKQIIDSFDSCQKFIDAIIHYYVVKKNKHIYLIIFGVYGAPMVADLIALLKDGGCKEIIFIGYAWGNNLPIGSLILPSRIYSGERLLPIQNHTLIPDLKILSLIKRKLVREQHKFIEAKSLSVPSVFYQTKFNEQQIMKYKIDVVDMELSSIIFFSKNMRIHSAGILIINENHRRKIYHSTKAKKQTIIQVFKALLIND